MVPSTRVVSTAKWCISWGNTAERCTHPWRVSIVPHVPIWYWISLNGLLVLPWKVSVIPHRHICTMLSLHWVLTILHSLFHLVSIQIQSRFLWKIDFDQPTFRIPYPLEHVLLLENSATLNKKKEENNSTKTKKKDKIKFTITYDEDDKCSVYHHLHLGTIPGNDAI